MVKVTSFLFALGLAFASASPVNFKFDNKDSMDFLLHDKDGLIDSLVGAIDHRGDIQHFERKLASADSFYVSASCEQVYWISFAAMTTWNYMYSACVLSSDLQNVCSWMYKIQQQSNQWLTSKGCDVASTRYKKLFASLPDNVPALPTASTPSAQKLLLQAAVNAREDFYQKQASQATEDSAKSYAYVSALVGFVGGLFIIGGFVGGMKYAGSLGIRGYEDYLQQY